MLFPVCRLRGTGLRLASLKRMLLRGVSLHQILRLLLVLLLKLCVIGVGLLLVFGVLLLLKTLPFLGLFCYQLVLLRS